MFHQKVECPCSRGGRSAFDRGVWENLQEVVNGLDFLCYELKVEPN